LICPTVEPLDVCSTMSPDLLDETETEPSSVKAKPTAESTVNVKLLSPTTETEEPEISTDDLPDTDTEPLDSTEIEPPAPERPAPLRTDKEPPTEPEPLEMDTEPPV